MASNSVLIVLTPNGRRETVKVTPNTSILQVLEDVCRKQGFNAQEYDLKHYNRIVEAANSVRFSGLPNKATLEMVLSSRPRQETSINLGLQLESGKRLMHSFVAQNTLWDVIKHWEAAGEPVLPHGSAETAAIQPVCVYMRQEIVGDEQLQRRTLRSLGLTHGSACIRLLHRTVEQLGYQANVSAPLTRPSAPKIGEDATRQQNSSQSQSLSAPPKPQAIVKPHGTEHASRDHSPSAATPATGRKKRPLSPVPMDTEDSGPAIVPVESPAFPLDLSAAAAGPIEIKPRRSARGTLHILGEHSAMLYHADDVSQPSAVLIPETFYNVTRSDIESIWRDLQAKRRELEDVPLSTSAIRNQEREAAILRNLQLHPISVVRIRFKNRYVLQGIFRAIDTVGAVMNMVKTYLAKPVDFYLFTSPPKTVLDPEQRLVEQGLVGSAVVYFGSYLEEENYLKPEILERISCPDAIYDYLQNMDKSDKPRIDPISLMASDQPSSSHQTGPSSQNQAAPTRPSRNTDTDHRVPKWFKPK